MMSLEANVNHIAKYYLITLGTGIIPLFIFNTLRSFIDALGQTRISMVIILIALPINILFNYMFIFGKAWCACLWRNWRRYCNSTNLLGDLCYCLSDFS